MAHSYITATGLGTVQTVSVPPYIDRAHIKVTIDGVETTSFTWVTSNTISLTATAGSTIKVARSSSITARLTDYTDGVPLTEAALDTDSLQAFYLTQEQRDAVDDYLALIDSYNFDTLAAETAANAALVEAALGAVGINLLNVRAWGAKGDGVTDDTTAIRDCVNAALAAGLAVYFPAGSYLVTSTIVVDKAWCFFGDGSLSRIVVTSPTVAPFTFDINTTSVYGWGIFGLQFVGPVTTNVASTALRFIGDSTAFINHGRCVMTVNGFNSAVKDEKSPRTTGFGLEGMLNWNRWDVIFQNVGSKGFWATQGSGTGNVWNGSYMMLNAASSAFSFEGSGCVVGDIIITGQFGCQNVGGGNGITVGDNTVYRAQIDVTGCQFDANVNVPLNLSAVGSTAYTNIFVGANNLGGATTLGAGLQPLSNSVIQDRDASQWTAGKAMTSETIGSHALNCFTITFGSYGAAHVRLHANGLVGGVDACSSHAEFEIRNTGGTLTVTPLETYVGVTNGFSFSISPAGAVATVSVTQAPTAVGTKFNATVFATGNNFKISRL